MLTEAGPFSAFVEPLLQSHCSQQSLESGFAWSVWWVTRIALLSIGRASVDAGAHFHLVTSSSAAFLRQSLDWSGQRWVTFRPIKALALPWAYTADEILRSWRGRLGSCFWKPFGSPRDYLYLPFKRCSFQNDDEDDVLTPSIHGIPRGNMPIPIFNGLQVIKIILRCAHQWRLPFRSPIWVCDHRTKR